MELKKLFTYSSNTKLKGIYFYRRLSMHTYIGRPYYGNGFSKNFINKILLIVIFSTKSPYK